MHAFESSQLSAVPGVHVPLWHVSLPSQALPSLQEAPFGSAACWQPVVGSQLSVVHWLPSLQLGALPGRQSPT